MIHIGSMWHDEKWDAYHLISSALDGLIPDKEAATSSRIRIGGTPRYSTA